MTTFYKTSDKSLDKVPDTIIVDYDQIARQIIGGFLENYTTSALDSKQRAKIHEIIEKYEGIESISQVCNISTESTSSLKKIIIQKIPTFLEKKTPIINSATIRFFCDYMKIPFPVPNEKYLNYYLDIMDKYYDCKAKWKIFTDVLEQKNIGSIKNELNTVYTKVIDYIKSHKEYKDFILNNYTIPDIFMGNELYSISNKNKTFLSIDVRTANYRVLKANCPSLCENLEWTEFIKKFTDNNFIINSKYAREVLFGKLGCKQIAKMPVIFIDNIDKHISTKYSSYLKKIRCSNDEIIYEISNDKIDSFSLIIDEFKTCVNELDDKCYRVEFFKLKQLGNYSYFVKEFIASEKVEFKKIPKKFSAQCIKYYEGKSINEFDRKFIDEMEMIATYDTSIFDV
jgi:hypothetical protein